MPSQSIGASVLPGSSSTIKHAIRLGKVEDEQLVGGEEGESASEDDDENIKAFLDAFRRGDVKNVGVEQNSDALIAALSAAYSAPPKSSDTTKTTTPVEAETVRASLVFFVPPGSLLPYPDHSHANSICCTGMHVSSRFSAILESFMI